MDILHSSPESLKTSLRGGKIVVAVYGLGHVGLGIAAVWLRAGAKVIGVDVKDEVVQSINKGVSPIKDEPGIPETISNNVAQGNFEATTDGIDGSKESDVKILAVPTTLTNKKICDLSALRHALGAIGQGLKKGDLVIIESSVPPTTTTNVAKSILEKASKLSAEEDFGLACSPERIYEGRILEDMEKRYPKIVGGIGPRSTEVAAALYEVIAQKGVIRTMNSTVAETSKLFEGIYRDANIALANELARFCGSIGIDFKEVRDAANSQPFCHLHVPGFVGGWCIPFYPYFVLQVANRKKVTLPLTSLARKINEEKAQLLVKVADSRLREAKGRGLKGSRVALLGLSFRADLADTRNSQSYKVIDLLLRKVVSEIAVYDPFLTHDPNLKDKRIHLTASVSEAVKQVDLILIMTDHSTFKNNLKVEDLMELASSKSVLVDGRDILARRALGPAMKISESWSNGFHIFTKKAD